MSSINSESSSGPDDQEMLDLADQPSFLQAQEDQQMKSASSNRRGRKPVPPSWSRVIDFEGRDTVTAGVFEVDQDLMDMDDDPPRAPKGTKKHWKPYFHPKTYWKENRYPELEMNEIGPRAMQLYAIDVS